MDSAVHGNFTRACAFVRRKKFRRWIGRPWRHLVGLVWTYVCYPLLNRPLPVSCRIITGDQMNVPLPAGLDLYLTGIKSHSSEQRLTAYLLKALRQGIVAIDAGAHLGYYSLIMHHCMGPAGRVLAFEPSAQIYPWLVRNTQVHAGIQTVQMMLGVREGTTAYHEFDLLHSESSTGQPGIALQREHQERMVPVTTLGAYCRAHGIRPSFIKIDVEGGELQVLQGAGDVLADVGAVVAEMRKEDFDQRYAPVEELMREYLFQPYRIDDEGDLHALDDVREHLMQLSEESDNLVFSKTSRR